MLLLSKFLLLNSNRINSDGAKPTSEIELYADAVAGASAPASAVAGVAGVATG
jgi:hypothetical protein